MDSNRAKKLRNNDTKFPLPLPKKFQFFSIRSAVKQENPPISNLEEATFFIDHKQKNCCLSKIAELIFQQLDKKDLLNCRHVSKQWKYVASKELQKIVTIKFEPEYKPAQEKNKTPVTYIAKLVDDPNDRRTYLVRPLNSLFFLFKNSPDFPCTSFKFTDPSAINPAAMMFLWENGSRVKKLELDDKNYAPGDFQSLKDILISKAPNLEHLILNCKIGFGKSTYKFRDSLHHTHDPEEKSKLKLKLKILVVHEEIPEAVLRSILEASPFLQEVELRKYVHLNLLVQPKNRLYLLHTFDIVITRETINILEIVADNLKGHCNLKTLRLMNIDFLNDENLKLRATVILNEFLNASFNSLRKLTLGPLSILEGLIFPQFKKVQELELSVMWHEYVPEPPFFPKGLKFSYIFPNVRILNFTCSRFSLPLFRRFHDVEPVESVRKIWFGKTFNDSETIQKMFPNATCTGLKWYEFDDP